MFGSVLFLSNWIIGNLKLLSLRNLLTYGNPALSFIGNCLIINVIGLSKFYYLARILLLPEWASRRVNHII